MYISLFPPNQVAQQHAEAISQDASIFDYDGVYDELKQSQTRPKVQEQTARQVGVLLSSHSSSFILNC